MFTSEDHPVPLCKANPTRWTEPRGVKQAHYAKRACLEQCPAFEVCRAKSADVRWTYPVVVAGWQPSKQSQRGDGFYPPWRAKAAK